MKDYFKDFLVSFLMAVAFFISLMACILTLSGCATPPDVIICADISYKEPLSGGGNIITNKGWCTKTLSNDEVVYEGDAWVSVKSKSLIIPADSWAKIKSYILKNCKKHQDCFNELGQWQRKAAVVDSKLGP